MINNEAKALDGIYLVPNGVHSILQIKEQQFAMHCDAMKEEFKLVMITLGTVLKNENLCYLNPVLTFYSAFRTIQSF